MGKALVPVLTIISSILLTNPAQAENGIAVRIDVLMSEDQPAYTATLKGFRQGLIAQGMTPVLEVHTLDRAGKLPSTGSKMIFALGSAAALRATELGVPVVFAVVGDPAGLDLMNEAHLPKKQATGVSLLAPAAKQMSLIVALTPDAKRIGVVVSKSTSAALRAELKKEIEQLGLSFVPLVPQNANTLGLELAKQEGNVDALLALADPGLWNSASVKAAVIFSIQKKKPLYGFSTSFTKAGAIASISAEDYEDLGAQAASSAVAISSGKVAGKMAIVPPRKLAISINLVVARRIGLEPSRQLLDSAEVVFR
jgi:putative ABC transport system substrate-binding protein